MLSQNVAKSAVPSYYMIRTNLPLRKPQNQWEGVFYFSGITKRQRHVVLMQRKRERMAAIAAYEAQRRQLLRVWDELQDLRRDAFSTPAAQNAFGGAQRENWVRLVCQLADCGLHLEASEGIRLLQGTGKGLHVCNAVLLLQHLSAKRLGECVLHSDAMGDPALPYKLLGDRGGEERAQEAYQLFETALAQLNQSKSARASGGHPSSSLAASQLINGLMEALLTCGYAHVKAIPNEVYDRMGSLGIAPTATTYEHILLALALIGDMQSAEDVHRFLVRHHEDDVGIRGYDALLLGYREAKAFDKCDAVWQGLVDRRWPRAAVSTAELYLRSVVDHSYTPVSEPLQRFGNLNVVEKKKVPVILSQMEELGVPRTQLSAPLQDEVEDALRKFSIPRNRFYEWGRAVKQFDFIEFRRRQGWMYDLHLMSNTTKIMPPVRDPTQPDATLVAAATAELPAFFSEKYLWERDALEELTTVSREEERVDDVRSGDIYYLDQHKIHERSSTWMTEVPQTRYDQLYGMSQPDIAKIGIRRHLATEYTNRSEILERDAALMRKTLSRGRRLRHRTDKFRTHRTESTTVPLNAS